MPTTAFCTAQTTSSSLQQLKEPVLFEPRCAGGIYRSLKNHAHFTGTSSQNHPTAFSLERSLPVLGRAQGGDEGNLVIEETALDWTFRPADLQGVNEAFAIFVNGESMMPKYKNGDLVYIHPTKPLVKGRFVLVETTQHKGFIKQFVALNDEDLVLKQFNPQQEIKIPRADIIRVMLAIGSLDC